ncbi:EDD domain protein, DegV family [Lachnospiraceae bacterium NK3A20]|jgi:DegV family protein with EDD domain|nr:EDD domain protein, DegV family [Lachnospiraceae bacterium NK3A20]
MAKIAVVTDSNAGITQNDAKNLGISVIPMPFMFGDSDETYYEDINLTREEFFQRLGDGQVVHSSQPSPVEVLKVWDKLLEDGYDEIVHIPMSSGLSGSCQSAMMLSSDYDGRVQVVNNQRISVTQKRSAQDALELAAKGWSAKQIKDKLEEVKFDSSIYIMLNTLVYLKRGGRITPAAAAIGSLLKLKPVLQIKGEKLDAFSKARTVQQGKNTMITAMKNDIEKLYGGIANDPVYLYAVHAQCQDEFNVWKQEVIAAFPNIHVEEGQLSLSISCHTGPGALAIACSRKLEELR